jgi:Xaa-Pro aminopeptidase
MRRGLISRSRSQLPDAVLDARLARLRGAMGEASLDALLVYTNNTRPAGVSWLTGFVPYWSEAMLAVTPTRAPVLVAALSNRVKSWIEGVSKVGEVVHTPRIGLEAGRLVSAASPNAMVGVVELDSMSTGIVSDLREGGPSLSVIDASALFARVRGKADPAEIALASQAAAIAYQALAHAKVGNNNAGEIIAAVEAVARRLGAEEVYIAAAPDLSRGRRLIRVEGNVALGERFALRASVAYRGSWVRLTRTLAHDGRASAAQAAQKLAEAVASLADSRCFNGFASWLVEGGRLTQPLETLMGSRISTPIMVAPGALVSVQACIEVEGVPVLIGAPALLGVPGEAASLLIQPVFD